MFAKSQIYATLLYGMLKEIEKTFVKVCCCRNAVAGEFIPRTFFLRTIVLRSLDKLTAKVYLKNLFYGKR